MIENNPYDMNPARNPTIEDLGGDALIDDPTYIPGAGEPRAAPWNNFVRLISALCRMAPKASLTINFVDGAPVITEVDSLRTSISASDFDLTDNGAGDVTISWDDALLPPITKNPPTFSHAILPERTRGVILSSHSVRVLVIDAAGAGSDTAFTVWIV